MFGQDQRRSKEAWLKEAEKAYEKVFGERDRIRKGGGPMTFSEIEDEAVREGNQLARWLLEGKISAQSEESGCHEETCPCPHCGKLAKRKREDVDTRQLRARPGTVSMDRYGYFCAWCRRVFFPSGRSAQPEV